MKEHQNNKTIVLNLKANNGENKYTVGDFNTPLSPMDTVILNKDPYHMDLTKNNNTTKSPNTHFSLLKCTWIIFQNRLYNELKINTKSA